MELNHNGRDGHKILMPLMYSFVRYVYNNLAATLSQTLLRTMA